MTIKAMTRAEAEKQILEHLKAIWEVYKAYNPNADYLTVNIMKNYLEVKNDFRFGGVDHEYPLYVHETE